MEWNIDEEVSNRDDYQKIEIRWANLCCFVQFKASQLWNEMYMRRFQTEMITERLKSDEPICAVLFKSSYLQVDYLKKVMASCKFNVEKTHRALL